MVAIEDWYDSQRRGLGREFREAVDHAIARIADNPLACPERYAEPAEPYHGDSPTCSGTGRLIALWLSSRAFTASGTPTGSALGFAGAPNERLKPAAGADSGGRLRRSHAPGARRGLAAGR